MCWKAGSSMPYFSPAFLYYNPYVLPAGQSLSLQYRIRLLPGALDAKAAENAWRQFAGVINNDEIK